MQHWSGMQRLGTHRANQTTAPLRTRGRSYRPSCSWFLPFQPHPATLIDPPHTPSDPSSAPNFRHRRQQSNHFKSVPPGNPRQRRSAAYHLSNPQRSSGVPGTAPLLSPAVSSPGDSRTDFSRSAETRTAYRCEATALHELQSRTKAAVTLL